MVSQSKLLSTESKEVIDSNVNSNAVQNVITDLFLKSLVSTRSDSTFGKGSLNDESFLKKIVCHLEQKEYAKKVDRLLFLNVS